MFYKWSIELTKITAYIKYFINFNAFLGHVLHVEKPGFDRRRKEDHVRPKTIKRV